MRTCAQSLEPVTECWAEQLKTPVLGRQTQGSLGPPWPASLAYPGELQANESFSKEVGDVLRVTPDTVFGFTTLQVPMHTREHVCTHMHLHLQGQLSSNS